jgi:uncharacterized protein (TIGR03435 family)
LYRFLLTAFTIGVGCLSAQKVSGPTFDVASIKAAPPPNGQRMMVGSKGGPGTEDPSRFSCTNCSVSMLVSQAFNLKRYQLVASNLSESDRFEITATIPPGTTKEQFSQMLQNLLIERFGLKYHREQKEMQVFELVVAKGGHKLKEYVEPPKVEGESADAPPPVFGPGPPKLDKDGFPELPPGRPGRGPMVIMMPGKARARGTGATIDQICTFLGNQLNKPVTDGTGLTGKYDYTLSFVPEGGGRPVLIAGGPPPPPPPAGGPPGGGAGGPNSGDPDGPTLIGAVQQQLGLKLEQKKGSVEILVVDHADKTPTEN